MSVGISGTIPLSHFGFLGKHLLFFKKYPSLHSLQSLGLIVSFALRHVLQFEIVYIQGAANDCNTS